MDSDLLYAAKERICIMRDECRDIDPYQKVHAARLIELIDELLVIVSIGEAEDFKASLHVNWL